MSSRRPDGELHSAAYRGDVQALIYMVNRVTVDQADSHGTTPLMWACMSGHADTVTFLLEKGMSDCSSACSHHYRCGCAFNTNRWSERCAFGC